MRTVTLASDISLEIPEMRVYAFSPSFAKVTAPVLTEITLTFNSLTQKRIVSGLGYVLFPLQPIFASFFADTKFGEIGTFTNSLNTQSKTIIKDAEITISGHSTADNEDVTTTQLFNIVWGAEQIAANYKQLETIYLFDGWDATITHNIGDSDSYIFIPEIGYKTSFGKELKLDSTFGNIIWIEGNGGIELKKWYIKNMPACPNSLYLRWIDLEGEYKYYLLQIGSTDEESKNGETANKYPFTTSAVNGVKEGRIKMYNKAATVSISCGIQTADDDQTELMRGLQESLLQWAYIGGNWVEVVVDAMTISRKRKEGNRQIDVKVILPQLYTQSL